MFVTDPAQVTVFDAVFSSIFGNGATLADVSPEDAPTTAAPPAGRPGSERPPSRGDARTGISSPAPGRGDDEADDELELPVARAGDEELLRRRSFDALEPHELAQLYELMSRLRLRPRRAARVATSGDDGASASTCDERCAPACAPQVTVKLAHRRRRTAHRRLVLLCDISGSMEPYARAYLQFLTAAGSGPNVEAFVFATRLTRVTRALASRNPERAIQRAAAAAPDWSSGTRIGDALREFNDRHGRRGMARGAVIVILSDGWERGDPMLVGREMERLARLAHRIVWVNPRVGADAFTVQSGGMVAALPFCDALVSGHSFLALGEVVEAIGAESWVRPDLEVGAPEEDEAWASATPIAGSSVGMPRGTARAGAMSRRAG